MSLNFQQQIAVKYATEGHSLLIHGAAGTGKSFVIKKIAENLIKENKNVYITATTGIACSAYSDAMTIHRWSGYGDGRYDVSEVADVIRTNKQFIQVKDRIINTDVLVIDEVSMMSKRFFDCLNDICKIKNPDLLFGGIQIILAGDFRQLAPVPNPLFDDSGKFCFTSDIFTEAVPHRVTLTSVIRQEEETLINAIAECSMGTISLETSDFIDSLKRPLDNQDVPTTMLFSKNEQVEDYNRAKILDFPGEMYQFSSTDKGDLLHLNKMIIPKCLWLKIGAPVILMRNLSDKLVNGLKGEVESITEDGPVIRFGDKTVPITRMKCSVFSPSKNQDVAVREQYPLKLAFAITIHKSQGMTLDRVEVSCNGIFKPGQLGVALGRARSTDGLRVTNFNPGVCLKQPAEVQQFISDEIPDIPMQQDLSCCRIESVASRGDHVSRVSVEEMLTIDADLDINESEQFDAEFDDLIRSIDEMQNESVDLPSDLDINAIVEHIRCEHVVTPMQYNVNKILGEIDQTKLKQFVNNEYSKLSSFVESYKLDSSHVGPVSAQSQTEFYTKVHTYQTTAEFRMNCLTFFESTSFTEEHLHICFNISNEVRKFILKKKAELFSFSNTENTTRTVTNAAHARVRYVGGYVVAKVHKKCIDKKTSNMYKTDGASQDIYEEAVVCGHIMDSLKVEEQYISANTSNPDSLLDVRRRQRQNRSLTNISDALFLFFCFLTEICLKLLVNENFNKHGQHMFEHIRNEIMSNQQLGEKFSNVAKESSVKTFDIFGNPLSEDILSKHIDIIYKKVIKLYLMVMLNQFRKDILEQFQVTKKMSHRKQILVSSKDVGKAPKAKKMKKSGVSQSDTQTPTDKTRKANKSTLEEPSSVSIAESVSEPSQDRDPVAGPSSVSDYDPEHNPGGQYFDTRGDSESEAESVLCLTCNKDKKYVKGALEDDWIQCDSCEGWTHRSCAGLKHHMKWKKAQAKGSTYLCKQCK